MCACEFAVDKKQYYHVAFPLAPLTSLAFHLEVLSSPLKLIFSLSKYLYFWFFLFNRHQFSLTQQNSNDYCSSHWTDASVLTFGEQSASGWDELCLQGCPPVRTPLHLFLLEVFPAHLIGCVPQGGPEDDSEVVKEASACKGHLGFFVCFVE